MDPVATLEQAEQFFSDCEFSDSLNSLADYQDWRLLKGYEPRIRGMRGDRFAANLMRRLVDALRDSPPRY